jgi:hypothetical protein
MDARAFLDQLERLDRFPLRRAVERLREGLFDPVAVRLLTAHEERLNRLIDAGFRAVDDGKAPHLAIVGAYGQGKSHSLAYIQDRALQARFVVSQINLDPREIPLHDFAQVYRTLFAEMRFPDADAPPLVAQWKAWAERQLKNGSSGALELLPAEMPFPFRAILAGLAQKTVAPAEGRRSQRAPLHPRTVHTLLARALTGASVPAGLLKQALQARGVPLEASLALRGPYPYLEMVRGLARLFQQLGYRGWVLLFDEGESVAQQTPRSRSRSYAVLDRLLLPDVPVRGLYPIFAFTDEFFERVQGEDYDKVVVRGELELPYFERNYADAWRDLTLYRLQDLSAREWEALAGKLVQLHAHAYRWEPVEPVVREALAGRLKEAAALETRARLKALVDQLDLVQQEELRSPAFASIQEVRQSAS